MNFQLRWLKVARLLILLLFCLQITVSLKAQCWTGELESDVSEYTIFCDYIIVTYKITSDCVPEGEFNIIFETFPPMYEPIDWTDGGELAENVDVGNGEIYDQISWIDIVIAEGQDASFSVTYRPTALTSTPGGNPIYVSVQEAQDVNPIRQQIKIPSNGIDLTFIDGPIDATALQAEFVASGGIVEILPIEDPDDLTVLPNACDPNAMQQLYISEGINFDFGTQQEPATYCVRQNQMDQSVIKMSSGAYIRVAGYTTLVLNDLEISGCQNMWSGIIVEDNAKLVLRNCVIKDAQYAITAERGATIECFNNKFEDNYVGIYTPPALVSIGEGGPDPLDPTNSYVSFVDFYGNEFYGTGSMLPAYNGQTPQQGNTPYAGILINDINSFRVPGITNLPNRFYDMSNGIIANRADFSVEKAIFENLQSDGQSNYPFEGLESTQRDRHSLDTLGLVRNPQSSSANAIRPYTQVPEVSS